MRDPNQVQMTLADLLASTPREDVDEYAEWTGMPEYVNEFDPPIKQVVVNFRTPEDVEAFSMLLNQRVTLRTKSVWYPAAAGNERMPMAWAGVDDEDEAE